MPITYSSLAILLCVAIAASDFLTFAFIRDPAIAGIGVATVIVATGIWLRSRFFRFAGAAFFALRAWLAIWALTVMERSIFRPLSLGLFLVCVLSLISLWLLLASKKFSAEFEASRNTLPRSKIILRRAFFLFLILAAVAAVANEIYNSTTE